MIKALIFDFVQTLGDAASGYKDGEKNSQNKLIEKFGITDTEKFLEDYRAVRADAIIQITLSSKTRTKIIDCWCSIRKCTAWMPERISSIILKMNTGHLLSMP